MRKFYYEFEDVYERDYVGVFATNEPLDLKKSVVVIPNGNGVQEMITAIPTKALRQYQAMANTRNSEIEDVICVVDTKSYADRLELQARQLELQRIMHSKIEHIKDMEMLKKYADKDSEFGELYKELLLLEKGATQLNNLSEFDIESETEIA